MATIIKFTRVDGSSFVITASEDMHIDRGMFKNEAMEGYTYSVGSTDDKDPIYKIKLDQLFAWLSGQYILKEIIFANEHAHTVLHTPVVDRTTLYGSRYIDMWTQRAEFKNG